MRHRLLECTSCRCVEIRGRVFVAVLRDVAQRSPSSVVGRRLWIREPDLACFHEQLAGPPKLALESLQGGAIVEPFTFSRAAGSIGGDGSVVATLGHLALARVAFDLAQRDIGVEPVKARVVRAELPA